MNTYEYEYTTDWFSHHILTWSQIFSVVIPQAQKILEIGSYDGRSTVWLLENVLQRTGGTVYCVDTWEGGFEHDRAGMIAVEERFDKNTAIALQKSGRASVTKLKGKSRAVLARLYVGEGENAFDFVYVDGSHQSSDVLEDLIGAFSLCKVGGVIACDDYLWEFGNNPLHTPKLAIDAFVNCFSSKLTLLRARLDQIYLVKTAA